MSGDETQRGTVVLVIAAVVFALLILPQVVEDDGERNANASAWPSAAASVSPSGLPVPGVTAFPTPTSDVPSDTGSGTDDGTGGGGDGGSADDEGSGGSGTGSGGSGSGGAAPPARTAPAVPRDPVADAFAAIRPGDCLNLFHTGRTWNTQRPQAVSCAGDRAFLRVSGVNVSCPAGLGRTDWSYGGTRLCLERQFSRGQCFLVKKEGGSGANTRFTAQLLTWVDCDARTIPSTYDSILVVTDVYRAPKTVPRGVCARATYDRNPYWYWVANGNRVLVCATYPDR